MAWAVFKKADVNVAYAHIWPGKQKTGKVVEQKLFRIDDLVQFDTSPDFLVHFLRFQIFQQSKSLKMKLIFELPPFIIEASVRSRRAFKQNSQRTSLCLPNMAANAATGRKLFEKQIHQSRKTPCRDRGRSMLDPWKSVKFCFMHSFTFDHHYYLPLQQKAGILHNRILWKAKDMLGKRCTLFDNPRWFCY